MALPPGAVTADTLITLKVTYADLTKKIKLPLKELTAAALPDKLRSALSIPSEYKIIIERYSDSAGGYIVLDKANIAVYKAVVRAAKAKGKLRLKISTEEEKKDTTTTPAPAAAPVLPAASGIPAAALAQASYTCVKPRMSGAGIFDYRASVMQTPEAPLPQPFYEAPKIVKVDEQKPVVTKVVKLQPQTLAFRTRDVVNAAPAMWTVYCNECDASLDDVHYHCSTCDGGDYDLCEKCINSGVTCQGEDHWLIKRFIRDGKVVTSVTERVCRNQQKEAPEVKNMPGGFAEEKKPVSVPVEMKLPAPTRTCNSCVTVLPEHKFVTCNDCDDFDLCITCHDANNHGHSTKHSFAPATNETGLSLYSQTLLKAGRNVAHAAVCDGCEKKIFGIRHKCLNCPDWDFCGDCYETAGKTHPRHRFAPIYEPLADPIQNLSRHFGIYCDGVLCRSQKNQSYIVGERYKCAVCHDTDFCANCEASPLSNHNRTHPLIKFRTAVRNVSITTTNEDNNGNVRNMGDRRAQAPVVPAPSVNTATAVKTVAEIPPTEEKIRVMPQPKDGDSPVSPASVSPVSAASVSPVNKPVASALLTAAFVRDTVPDGTVVTPGTVFTQIWTLRNEGPFVWPAGCSVRFVGGDNMLNVDNFHPASVSDIAKATESSVVAREVQVHEEISFRITLRAPMRTGKSISYWRLKAADGTPFGHRLWCDINVRTGMTPEKGEKVINAPTQATFAPINGSPSTAADLRRQQLQQMSKAQMYETQRRLLEEQRVRRQAHAAVWNSRLGIPTGPVSGPLSVKPFQEKSGLPDPALTLPGLTETDRLRRKEAAKARVDAIKAKILRYRAENEKLHAKMMQPVVAPVEAKEPVEDVKVEVPVKEEPKEEVKEEIKEEETKLGAASSTSSLMVFPKLEKESPASSIISSAKPAYVQDEEGEVEQSAAMPEEALHDDEPASPLSEDFDDLEVVSTGIVSDDEDDGFLTDEEYDILDASDRETVASP